MRFALKDPESARFRDVMACPTPGVVAGLVNARNSMGGYVGEKRFFFSPTAGASFEPDDTNSVDPQKHIDELQKQIDWLQALKAVCPAAEMKPLSMTPRQRIAGALRHLAAALDP